MASIEHTRTAWHWVRWSAAAVLLFAVGMFAVCESMGWPFLQAPLQRFLTNTLQRDIGFATPAGVSVPAQGEFRVYLLGGIDLRLANLRVAAPAWSSTPHLLTASDVGLQVRYADVWRAHQGQALHIRSLRAATMDAQLERMVDGRASWQFGKHTDQYPPGASPSVGKLQIASGVVHFKDEPRAIDMLVRLSLTDAPAPGAAASPVAVASQALAAASAQQLPSQAQVQLLTLQAHGGGKYRGMPAQVALTTTGSLPWVLDDADGSAVAVPLTLSASVGRATLAFQGSAMDLRHMKNVSGRFTLTGPSLAAVGDPVGVTLPTTAAFRVVGRVVKQGDVWNVVADDATVGSSRLNGAFQYDRGRATPMLAGRLGGSKLVLADLGPALGGAVPPAQAMAASAAASAALPPPGKVVKAPGKLLPARPFDLGALRKMDADVLVDVGELNLNTSVLEPLRPLRTHLRLAGGVLSLDDLDARTAQGRLQGNVKLDGRTTPALWHANLRWSGVRLERWLQLKRTASAPPYITGELSGRAVVDGQGSSTADMLGSLNGQVHAELRGGTISHLVVEAAGLDVAQGLGLLFKGDDALPVTCGVTELVAQQGQFRPRVMVLDTPDSSIWINGSLSLATESMDLRAVVSPKDFSPLSLRTPLQLRGSFADPEVSVQKAPLGRKLGGALLLGLINPLASLLALVDPGDPQAAGKNADGCKTLVQKGEAARAAAARP